MEAQETATVQKHCIFSMMQICSLEENVKTLCRNPLPYSSDRSFNFHLVYSRVLCCLPFPGLSVPW